MMNGRKILANLIFFIAIFSITFYYIFHNQDLSGIIETIKDANTVYWLVAILFVIFFICTESIIIYYMMQSIRQKVKVSHCILYSFTGFFFSCITPSATGGQPAQIYLMKKDKIPLPISTLILMIVTITYKMVLVILGSAVLIFRPGRIIGYLEPVIGFCYFGLLINMVFVVFMLVLVFHPTLAKKQLTFLVELLGKIRLIRKKEKYLAKIEKAMEQYKDVAYYFRTHKIVTFNVFILTVIQRLMIFYVTYLTYQSFGLKDSGFTTIVILQGMISVAVDMLPLPGGMGISEKMFLTVFEPVSNSMTLPAMVVSRGLSFYTELILSAIFTVVAFFTIGRISERKMQK
ncbi:MAG TPA: lysylphosphatidylglycerol synthase transmembrane domain-containing protein [Mobilitalea sp.]|nr:lysylphosphatidylglycerol synthase transmembrane domain-containing protein [Mobilitalea sp.]